MSDNAEVARVSFQIGDRAVFTRPGWREGTECAVEREDRNGVAFRYRVQFADGYQVWCSDVELTPLAASPETPHD